MRISKSYKIITLLSVFILSFCFAFFAMGKTGVSADVETSSFFTFSGESKFESDKFQATVKNGDVLKIKNKLVINDFELKQALPVDGSIEKVEITFESNSYYGSGMLKDESVDKTIKNVLTLDIANGKFDLNGVEKTGVSDFSSVKVSVQNGGVVSATVNSSTAVNTDTYYSVSCDDKAVANVSLKFTVKSGVESATYEMLSVDQKASDASGAYKQTFEMLDGNFKTFALPRVSVESDFLTRLDGTVLAISGRKYSLTFSRYSFTNNSSYACKIASSNAGSNDGKIWTPTDTEDPTEISFNKKDSLLSDVMTFTVGTTSASAEHYDSLETYTVSVQDKTSDTELPVYDLNESAMTSYAKAIEDSVMKDYEVTDANGEVKKEKHYVRLGDSLTLPSFKGLVSDNVDSYGKLSYTVCYRTPSSSTGSSSSLKITLTDPGDYMFYVLFKDGNGNVVKKDLVEDKIKENDYYATPFDNPKVVKVNQDSVDYYIPVFNFHIEDDAPIYVYPTAVQTKGYIGTEYVASPFTIEESGSQTVYTLYYNANTEAGIGDEGWVKIPTASSIAEDYSENGFNYDDIKGINYDGKLTFTPVKGSYYISCVVTSQKSDRSMAGQTDIIRVNDKIKQVKVDTHWLQNNLLSVVFLGIGTLCLIGIVVLLFIKPKEEDVDGEDDK